LVPSADEATQSKFAGTGVSFQEAPEFVEVYADPPHTATSLVPSAEEATPFQSLGDNALEIQIPPESTDVQIGPL
jgi:hypothetical protein